MIWRKAKRFIVLIVLVAMTTTVLSKTPDCTNANAWPSGMTLVHLKNAGIVTSEKLDFSKAKVTRIASEKIGNGLFRQVHLVTMFKLSGEKIVAIAVGDVSTQECSASGVDVYVVSQVLGDYTMRQ